MTSRRQQRSGSGRRVLRAAGAWLVAVTAALVVCVTVGFASTSTASVSVNVGATAAGPPILEGFVGTTMEFYAVPEYAGSDPNAIDPVLVSLLSQLAPGGQRPVLRIGGASTDTTWWPVTGVARPAAVNYDLTPAWLQTTSALVHALNAQLIVGVNLGIDRPDLAAAEAQALLGAIGPDSIRAFEIGNEPDRLAHDAVSKTAQGTVYARPRSYGVRAFASEFSQIRSALPAVPVAGPGYSGAGWMSQLGRFLTAERPISLVTFHRYPLSACGIARKSRAYPTIADLLANSASHGLASGVAPFVAIAHAHGLPFRIDEMNSVSCGGARGVSDTFASALWALDALFEMAHAGVDGVNIQTSPGGSYELFTPHLVNGVWQATVRPEYYGLMMFAQAATPGSRLLPLSATGSPLVKSWATRAQNGTTRVVLINKDVAHAHIVHLTLAGVRGSAALQRLLAPSARATSGVTFGGQSFGAVTFNGELAGQPKHALVRPRAGVYTVRLPAASAALLTLRRAAA